MPGPDPIPPEPRLPAPVREPSSGGPRRDAVVALQERLVERALASGASDLHLEPQTDRLRVRLRIDGRLHDLEPLPGWLTDPLAARFKILGHMDVTEKRLPQDGRATQVTGAGEVDLRIATLASRHGEVVVVRLLPRSRRPPRLEELGLETSEVSTLRGLMARNRGLILAAGPTGAGKTTTLYTLLREIDPVGQSVVALEDPVEYHLPEMVQVPVRPRIGLGFARALRAVLRQDPDVVLVGEIRDEETARVALRASITGHLVLSSIHTNDAVSTATRLLDLGAAPYLVAAGLLGVVSQRLVRTLCPTCRRRTDGSPRILRCLGCDPDLEAGPFWEPEGCPRCLGGYKGRTGIFEVLAFDRRLSRLLADGGTADDLSAAARRHGLIRPLEEAALAAVRRGSTSAEEAVRAAGGGRERSSDAPGKIKWGI